MSPTVVLLDQPACGRHLGQDMEMLQRNGNVKPLCDEGEGEAFALIVPPHAQIGSCVEDLVEDVPFTPLSIDKYAAMLSGNEEHTGSY